MTDHPDKVILYYNPKAGNGIIKSNLDRIIELCQHKRQQVIPIRADAPDRLNKFFQRNAGGGYSKLIAAGGDGTINNAVNAMVKNGVHMPLGIIPTGTSNDLANYFDMPQRFEDVMKIAMGDHHTTMDVGMANERAFVNVLAMGMIVDVSQKTDPNIKNTLGIMSYYLRGMAEIPRIRPIPIKITSAEMSLETKMYAMLVMNGKSAGGFRRISPDSKINDGMFEVIIFENAPITNLGPLFISVLTGHHTENKSVIYFRTSSLKIESDEDLGADVDGETADSLPIDVRMLADRIEVCTLTDDMEGNQW